MILKCKVSKLTSQCQLVRNTKARHLTDWFGIRSKALDCDGEAFEVTAKEWGKGKPIQENVRIGKKKSESVIHSY